MRTTTYPNAVAERTRNENAGLVAPLLTKTIPFDYVFEFKLKGKDPNNVQDIVKLQDVVEISMQGVFVGVSIGYSFVLDERKTPRIPIVIDDNPTPPTPPTPVLLSIPSIPGGEEVEPPRVRIAGSSNAEMTMLRLTATKVERLINTIEGSDDVQKFDDVLNSLGSSQSEALFTTGPDGTAVITLPKGIGTSGLHVWDRGNNLLSAALQSCAVGPNPSSGAFPNVGDSIIYIHGSPSQTASVLFFERRARRGSKVQTDTGTTEFTFNENGWAEVKLLVSEPAGQPPVEKRLSPGDLLLVSIVAENPEPPSVFAVPSPPRVADITLGALLKGLSSSNAGITSGVRPSQRLANLLAANPPLGNISRELLEKGFELAPGSEDVSFLYSIDIVSSGRELQNKPIHNIAGLGIANGDRPFRPFARPIAFEPRSVIRIQIEELSTLPGTLYIVLQGYKTLGTGRRPE